MADASKIYSEADGLWGGNHRKDASMVFEKRMHEMQQEMQQMQKIQMEMKQEDANLHKTLNPLQRDLDDTTKQLGNAQSRKQKLLAELKACEEEIVRLSQKKEAATAKIFAFTAEAENKRVGKLSLAVGFEAPVVFPVGERKAAVSKGDVSQSSMDLMADLFSGDNPTNPNQQQQPSATGSPLAELDLFGGGGASDPSDCFAPSCPPTQSGSQPQWTGYADPSMVGGQQMMSTPAVSSYSGSQAASGQCGMPWGSPGGAASGCCMAGCGMPGGYADPSMVGGQQMGSTPAVSNYAVSQAAVGQYGMPWGSPGAAAGGCGMAGCGMPGGQLACPQPGFGQGMPCGFAKNPPPPPPPAPGVASGGAQAAQPDAFMKLLMDPGKR